LIFPPETRPGRVLDLDRSKTGPGGQHGIAEFQVSNGEIRRLGPGTILLAEDTVGKGHVSEVVSAADVKAVVIQQMGEE
jgi:hypothetical protein